jgi:hypothetical protein
VGKKWPGYTGHYGAEWVASDQITPDITAPNVESLVITVMAWNVENSKNLRAEFVSFSRLSESASGFGLLHSCVASFPSFVRWFVRRRVCLPKAPKEGRREGSCSE